MRTHSCELFSVRKSKADFDTLERDFDHVTASLADQGIDVRYKTDISADPKKLSDAISSSLKEDTVEIFLFANALNTSDNSSFKSLFYEFIAEQEATLTPDEAHAGTIPKIKIFSLGDMGNGYKGYCFRYRGKIFVAVPYASLTGMDISELLYMATFQASDILHQHLGEYPDGIAYLEGSKAGKKGKHKEGFFMSFIPHKGDTGGDVVRKVIVLVAIAAFCVSLGILISIVVKSEINKAENRELRLIAHYGHEDAVEATTETGEKLPEEDWPALKKVNDEIVGWITLKGTPINYPVLLHEGDDKDYQYYLEHSYKKEYSDYGAIFVDYRSKEGTNSKNVILHGHNMLDGSMFHELVNYSSGFSPNLDYYKKHSVITFNTPDGDSKWKIISVFKTSTLFAHGEFFNYMQGVFHSDAEFMNFVYNVRIRSMFNTPVMVNEDDQLLTLSTCSYEFKNWRTVVVARKVRPGEDEKVNVQEATINEDPLYPDVYYSSYGGSRPDVITFSVANDYGEIDWYDGKGNLEGSEDLTDTIAANQSQETNAEGLPVGYIYYFVTYRNFDESQIAAYTVREGDPLPVPDIIPSYEDEYYTYTFDGWNLDIDGVDFNSLNTSLIIYPKYTAVRKVPYTFATEEATEEVYD